MATTSQTHRALFGRGQLLRDNEPPIDVRYDIVLSARPIDTGTLDGRGEMQWEWDKVEGFVTLVNNVDLGRLDMTAEYTLVLADGIRFQPVLRYDHNMSLTRYLVEFSPNDVAGIFGPAE